MKTNNMDRRLRSILYGTGALLSCILLMAIVYDPIALISDAAAAARVRRELPRAVERWEATAPTSYRIHVKGTVPSTCLIDADLTVRDGQLSEVRARENPLVPESPLLEIGPDQWEVQGCRYRDLTIEGMFQRVATGLGGIGILGAPLEVKFDGIRGFITEYRVGRASQGGAFGYTLGECCTWFAFTDFSESPP